MNIALRNNIDWVGYVDWTIRDFHGYNTEGGVTYNSYLIRDEKTVLIDTVKAPYVSNLIQNVSKLTDLSKIDYVVCNHAEPDHSGGFPEVMKACSNAVVVCNQKCKAALSKYYDVSDWKFHIVKTGDTLSLGKRTLHFIDTPMAHWPESMFTYVPEEKLLFSMDAFGQHFATSHRFDDEVSFGILMDEAKTYYANILTPYGKFVKKVFAQISELDIEMIAPSHGLVIRSNVKKMLSAYSDWVSNRKKAKVLIIYDTMLNSTEDMARAILEGASISGVEAKLIHTRINNLTSIATEALDAASIAFGSPTLNSNIMPMAGAALIYLKGLKPVGKDCFAFGSYGWSKGGTKAMEEYFKDMNWNIMREPITAQFRPTPEILEECRIAGKSLAEKAIQSATVN